MLTYTYEIRNFLLLLLKISLNIFFTASSSFQNRYNNITFVTMVICVVSKSYSLNLSVVSYYYFFNNAYCVIKVKL